MQPGFVADLLARVAVRYPTVPVVFAGSRTLAEEWTYRYLAAALAEARGDDRFGAGGRRGPIGGGPDANVGDVDAPPTR